MKREWVSNDTTRERAHQRADNGPDYWRWRSQFVEGEPLPPPNSPHSAADLKRMGLVGLYRVKGER